MAENRVHERRRGIKCKRLEIVLDRREIDGILLVGDMVIWRGDERRVS